METNDSLYATCVSIEGQGVLLTGPSGAGKSDLALRLIDAGAVLVGDDQVFVHARRDRLWARGSEALQGLIEARGVGILRVPFTAEVPIACGFTLLPDPALIERLPDPEVRVICGVSVPFFQLYGLGSGACALVGLVARGARPLEL